MFDIPELLEHFRGKITVRVMNTHFISTTQDFVPIYGEKKYFL